MLLAMVGANESAKRPLIGLCHSHPKTWPDPPNGTRRVFIT